MTTVPMMALDLSAKCSGESSKPPSPTLSMSSDPDTSFDTRPTSAFSDRDSDRLSESGFIGQSVKPRPGPLPSGHVMQTATDVMVDKLNSMGHGGSRPFKMYPAMDPMSGVYSQMAASAASLSAGIYSPYGAAASPGSAAALPAGMGFMDNMLNMSSPITQYLNQKRRRSESRMNRGSGPDMQHSPGGTPFSVDNSALISSMMQPSPTHSIGDTQSSTEETPAKRQRTSSVSYGQGDRSLEERRDDSYWDRRRKNNEAAKRSRDARRMKEEEIALRAAFLEQENLKLRAQVTILKNETAKLHYMLYNRV